ncbi:unnamed protein product [Diabrotica balteata]|uniref:Uncharacterized protein n=1 Tax=Diabrotica balteata TaxID=107213 RepID=A0A9N9TBZ1_DIABA|nr:unnamed protein product [Diabrotica balteata]
MNRCIKIIILVLLCTDVYALFGDSLKKLRQKASDIYKTKHSGKLLNFLGHVASEYPGTNEKYIKINDDLWEDYYNCLKRQEERLGQYLSMSPEAVLGFVGGNVKLSCKICINPQEKDNIELVVWEWAPIGGKHLEPVELHENIVLSPEEKTLHLYNLDSTHSGQYMCTLGESATIPYFLTVVNLNESDIDQVHSPEAPFGPYPKKPQFLEEYGLVLDTEWSDWSTCSACGKVGKRHKLGIPCKSHILPTSIKELKAVDFRKNEIMIGFCKVDCPTNELFIVKDKHGNIIEQANNSAGIYSMLQSLPPLEPPVARNMLYVVKGKTIVLTCPGSMNTDAPIHWQVGNKNLIPEIISAESKGRIFVTITDRIHINDARIADSNSFSCWQRDELAGTIRLIVEKKMEFNFNHTIMLIGVLIPMPGATNFLNEITEEVQQKLSENGIITPQGFLVNDIENLIKITGMSAEEIKDLKIKVSRSIHKPANILKAIDLVPCDRLSTGCVSIDRIIRGGIPLSGITEIYGYSGVGKTQLCLQLALQVQLSVEEGGLNKGAVYICTEDVFPTKRFHQMAQFFKIRHNLSNKNLESNVFLKHASDITELTNCVSQDLRNLLRRESIGLIVLDSIAGPFKGENEKELLLRSGDLISLVEQLYVIQEEYPVAVVCTNQVTETIDGTANPCLGVAWSNSINHRCQISRSSRVLREFKVIFSSDVQDGKCYFHITEEGLKSDDT